MKKDTAKLLEELQSFSDFAQFYEKNQAQFAATSLSNALQTFVSEKNLVVADVVKNSEMSEVYAYQILSGIKSHPGREKVLCLAFGMGLSGEETQTLLKTTGYAPLYAKRPADAIVLYGLYKHLSVVEINNLLYEYGQETLG